MLSCVNLRVVSEYWTPGAATTHLLRSDPQGLTLERHLEFDMLAMWSCLPNQEDR